MLVLLQRSGRTVLSVIIAGALAVSLASADQSPPSSLPEPDSAREPRTAQASVAASASAPGGTHQTSSPSAPQAQSQSASVPSEETGKVLARLAELRAETIKRIATLDALLAKGTDTKSGDAADPKLVEEAKAVKPLLQARLDWMEKYESAETEYRRTLAAKPEEAKAKAKGEIGKLNALLDQAEKTPEALLPKIFLKPAGEIHDAERAEMKDAIESVQGELTEWTSKFDTIKRNTPKGNVVRGSMGAERNKIFQRVTALKAKMGETDPPASKTAKADPLSQRIYLEQRVNLEWETQVESLLLTVQEAKIAREEKLLSLAEIETQAHEAHVKVARKTLELMRFRFQVITDQQQTELKLAAKSEEKRAAKSEDLLDGYRARRNAEHLEMEAQVVKFEQTLAANPSPAPQEQQDLVDRAKVEFERTKQLLQDGEISRLDASRLNNEFRRIGPERERILRSEMAIVETRLQYYSDSLTEADLELIEDAHQDEFEHNELLERLPAARKDAAGPVLEEIEKRHREILVRRVEVLRKLTDRATDTHKQVKARLAVIDDLEGFIRTSIFWVRDQDPIGPGTVVQVGREVGRVGNAFFRLTSEVLDRRNWGRVSVEFAVAAAGLVVLPLGLPRLRRRLTHRIADDLPTAEPVRAGTAAEPETKEDDVARPPSDIS